MARSEQPTRAREIFESALDIASVEERAAYVKSACGGDAALLERVQALLQANNVADSFLPNEPQASHVIGSIEERPGTVIGRYKLLQKIGEGGMGVVYMAEQEEPVRRKVALKIIKLGMDTRQVVARFEAERQALALMDHPNIAKVFDVGVVGEAERNADFPVGEKAAQANEGGRDEIGDRAGWKTGVTGRPYFVMELVQGVPITEFCEKNQLSVQERIKLFIPVCQAIQSAHQKGIIHRDLKPSNVLVTLHDGMPMPKVIDFGVAKAINQKLTEKTLFTNFATMIGTPAYMSPEQAEMSGLDIDTRSDIYGLGVLLYELLTGTTPFPEKRLRSVAYLEMQRIILEEEPERPSTRLRKKRATVAARLRASQAAPSPRPSPPVGERVSEGRVRGTSEIDADLDWIVMKCLEKDRSRRYETANALTADIQRHLKNEPVIARPPSAAYRFQKLVRRHRAASTAVALVALAVLMGVAVSTWALLREHAAHLAERAARVQEQAALKQANQRLSAALGFVNQVVTNVAPEITHVAGAAKAQEALLQAGLAFVQQLRESAADDPSARVALARLLLKVSQAQNPGDPNTVGDYQAGLERANEALSLLSANSLALPSTERLNLLYLARFAVAQCLAGLGRFDDALAEWDKALPLLDELERFPRNVAYPPRKAECVAQQGAALLRTGFVDPGLLSLAQARDQVDDLVRKDAANDRFRYSRIVITTIQAVAFAGWSEEISATLPERHRRFEEAEKYLTEAEQFARSAKSKTAGRYLEFARAEVAAARSKISPEERPSP